MLCQRLYSIHLEYGIDLQKCSQKHAKAVQGRCNHQTQRRAPEK
jgi:hypothetical protein